MQMHNPPHPVEFIEGVVREPCELSAEIGHDGADLLIAATALKRGGCIPMTST